MEFDLQPFLEALPLPVMVRSELGIMTNQLWQEHCRGELSNWELHQGKLGGIFADWEIIVAQHKPVFDNSAQQGRVKPELLTCVTHELRSPLTVVLGMTELLERQLHHHLTEQQRHYLKAIHRSGHRLAQVISTMVDVTQAETGHLKLHLTTVKILPLCQQVIQQLQQQDLPRPPRINLAIAPDVDTIVADPSRLQQMLGHLLHNACQFSAKDQVPEVELRVEAWQNWMAFSVWHRSIAKGDQRLPPGGNFSDPGLGLILTRHLARLHGGDVTFRSYSGKGNEFTLLLPSAPLSCPYRQLVLIAEVNPQQITTIADAVSQAQFFPVVARSGVEALEKARQFRPVCIFANYNLPLLGGKDIRYLLQQDSQCRSIPLKLYQQISADQVREFLPKRTEKILCIACQDWTETNSLPFRCMTVDDVEQAERFAPLWQPNLIVLGQATMLDRIYTNTYLGRVPIVVRNSPPSVPRQVKLVSCPEGELLATLQQLLGTIPPERN
ncbi:MAG: hybrid sensor histidine kinase/response regulator [Pseudanabaenaceae cyanobacterium SKYGB_i_bin29]|nr:hybrid sensor histidine kinase/response regulator [Pseudanabaenaceae cyanobacterium SKYG29]MDW8422322.1 hybrid sensor histidine kinase/response regulator [Pseudanabaenaceae cyanobacterium SKYGB_i_bin29]